MGTLADETALAAHQAWLRNDRSRIKAAAELGIPKDTLDKRLATAWKRWGKPQNIPDWAHRAEKVVLIDRPRFRVKLPGKVVDTVSPRTFAEESALYAAQQGYAPDFDLTHSVPEGLTLKGTSINYRGDGTIRDYWNKTKAQGRLPEETVQLPDPKKIDRVSTNYGSDGRVTQQWVSEKATDAQRETLWQAFADGLKSEMPRAEPVTAPAPGAPDLLAVYPVGDHHLGMLSWDVETGANYDLSIGERLLCGAIDYLVEAAPSCQQALVAFLGDLVHYDSFESVTPTSRNLLDADGRFPKMVRVAIRAMRYTIQSALKRHQQVHVIVEIGNHDLSSAVFLMECLSVAYENEPRVTIDTSPRHYHYFDFGQCLIGTHHGHGAKMDSLPLIMATDRADAWGRTKFRYWFTGHIHHAKSKSVVDRSQDYNGCSVESFRILPPTDAYGAQKGYRASRDMKAIVMHREFGEVARHTVNPDMF
jgi:hypothetical protein